MASEMNFDGLVGQTHNYAGLSFGNMASMGNSGEASNPRAAALEGLAKMKALHDMGLKQGVIPPHERPHLATLRAMGFEGSLEQAARAAYEFDPIMLAMACSASSMWVANAATVSPSADTKDGRVHFTPANLQAKLHRSIEPAQTSRLLRAIFASERHFTHHAPLPLAPALGDEGAANHTRHGLGHAGAGVEVFTWGRSVMRTDAPKPSRFPARQTLEASRLIARSHGLTRARFVQQHPGAIDAGVFHNDVIAVGNAHVLLIHERAWLNQEAELRALDGMLEGNLCVVEVPAERVSLQDAVSSYLFNSQIVSLDKGHMALICASECEEHEGVHAFIQETIASASNPISQARFFNLKQSMRNGGGPACLRLRVVLTPEELAAVNPACVLTDALYAELTGWVERHYRDSLLPKDLIDPALAQEVHTALDELTRILELGDVYPFQL